MLPIFDWQAVEKNSSADPFVDAVADSLDGSCVDFAAKLSADLDADSWVDPFVGLSVDTAL